MSLANNVRYPQCVHTTNIISTIFVGNPTITFLPWKVIAHKEKWCISDQC